MRLDELRLVGPHSRERLIELSESLRGGRRRWALLVGAGVSRGAGVPVWRKFVTDMCAEFDVPCNERALASVFPTLLDECRAKTDNETEFWDAVVRHLCIDMAPTDLQNVLMQLPFGVFTTTNLDCLLEQLHAGLAEVGNPRVASYPSVHPVELGDRRLVHLHGICPCDEKVGALHDGNCVVTASAYEDAYSDGSMLPLAVQSLFADYRVLLVGASMGDPDFAQMISAARRRAKSIPVKIDESRRHLAFVATELPEADEAIEWEWEGKPYGIDPIHYFNPRSGDHSALLDVVRWLAEQVQPPPVEGDGGSDLE